MHGSLGAGLFSPAVISVRTVNGIEYQMCACIILTASFQVNLSLPVAALICFFTGSERNYYIRLTVFFPGHPG